MPDDPSLYERLGGVFAIATVVDDFIDRVMADARLNANPKVDEAHHKIAPAGFKYLVTEQVCEATGGPQRYTGRSMYDSHAELGITEEEWQAFRDDPEWQRVFEESHRDGIIVKNVRNQILTPTPYSPLQ